MSLIFCPECGIQVSEHAQQCVKCAYPIKSRLENNYKKNENNHVDINEVSLSVQEEKTEMFSIISFAAGLGGFLILPIFFVPIGYIASIVAFYRLKEFKDLKGNNLRIMGAILTTINILWLMYTYRVGFFED